MLTKIKNFFFSPFKIKKDNETLSIIKDNKPLINIIIDKDNKININFSPDIIFIFNNKLEVITNNSVDVTTFNNDIKIDTWHGNLYLNSYNSKAIKDLPEAIELREKIQQELEQIKIKLIDLEKETERFLPVDCNCKGEN